MTYTVQTPAVLLPPSPGIPPVARGKDAMVDMDDLEAEAKDIKGRLVSADRYKTSQLLAQLRALGARMPAHGRRARRSANIIQMVITQAEQQLAALDEEQTMKHFEHFAHFAFQAVIYTAMSQQAKVFYNNIDANATYEVAPVTAGGVVVTDAKIEVDGEHLRSHFSMIKYHSMSESEKKDVLSKTFGTDKDNELVSRDAAVLKRERDELGLLHRALEDMEAYKAFMGLSKSGLRVQKALIEIAYDHQGFARAHGEVDALLRAYDRLMQNPADEEAATALKLARARMKKTLKEEIIDRILLDADEGAPAKAGEITPPLTPLAPRTQKTLETH